VVHVRETLVGPRQLPFLTLTQATPEHPQRINTKVHRSYNVCAQKKVAQNVEVAAKLDMKNGHRNGSGPADPTRISPFDEEDCLRVVIETPRGSRNKYAYDSEEGIFLLKKVLPAGMTFPYDFGFVPGTKAEDGDPIDVLVLIDEAAFPGCVIKARVLGTVEAEERQDREKRRNDRLIAVSVTSHAYSELREIKDLGKKQLRDLKQFFQTYQHLDGKEFEILQCTGSRKALKLIASARI
jgi:inorganic pyrophosphatase